jgi:hypothetical protein
VVRPGTDPTNTTGKVFRSCDVLQREQGGEGEWGVYNTAGGSGSTVVLQLGLHG